MNIEYIAIWTRQLEALKTFYETCFRAHANQKYANPKKHFESYFLAFSNGVRLEIMQMPEVSAHPTAAQPLGHAHLAFSVGSRYEDDQLAGRLRADGLTVESLPRITSDGYNESVVLDPDGNRIEIIL
ncbi:MAG TPA: VOC family protein [Levilinea sp.]|nr:VOC family protein [Levilinea sp.]